jgi:hypothetical protein
LSALKKQARLVKNQPGAEFSPEQLTTSALIHAWQQGDVRVQAWVENAVTLLV